MFWSNANSFPHPTKVEDLEKRRNSTANWHMGNPRKCRELIGRFGQTTSLHGMTYVCAPGGNNSCCVTIAYRVFFSVCVLLVLYSVVSLVQENFGEQSTFITTINRDTTIGFEEDPENFPLFPRITICKMPSYRTDFNMSHLQLVEYVMLSLGSPFSTRTPEEMSMLMLLASYQVNNMVEHITGPLIEFQERLEALEERYQALKSADDFDLRQFIIEHSYNCSEFFVSCHFLPYTIDCCELFEPVLTSIGLCFTFRFSTAFGRAPQLFTVSTVKMALDLSAPPTLTQLNKIGFRLLLSDPFKEAPVFFETFAGDDIIPGITATIKSHLVKTQRTALYTPWHGMWNTCPPKKNETSFYSINSCIEDNSKRLMRRWCKCEPLIHSEGSLNASRVCEPIDFRKCFFQAIAIKTEYYNCTTAEKEFKYSCDPACTDYAYKTESTIAGLGGNGNVTRVLLIHDTRQFIYDEYRKKTIPSLLSQIGGSLGLYLGASIITVMEILTFGITWIWYRLAPAKTTPTSAKVHKMFDKGRHSSTSIKSYKRRRRISDCSHFSPSRNDKNTFPSY